MSPTVPPSSHVPNPPSVVVDLASPVRSATLPSPDLRYSELLSALQDVIGLPSNVSCQENTASTLSRPPEGAIPGQLVVRTDGRWAVDLENTLVDGGSHDTIHDSHSSHVISDIRFVANEGDEHLSYVDEMDTKGDEDEDGATMVSTRRLSSASDFTGASLLASPPTALDETDLLNGSPLVLASSLLSPVEMSAKLLPFSLYPPDPPMQRRRSVDSAYADSDSWMGPRPLRRTPPPKQSPSTLSSPPYFYKSSREGIIVRNSPAPCPSPPPLASIAENVPQDVEEDDDDTAFILDAYESSPSDMEDGSNSPTLMVSTVRPPSGRDLVPTSPVGSPPVSTTLEANDDTLDRAALSNQPSLDFSVASSSVSVTRQDSIFSHSGFSTPNTSLFSHDSDAWRGEEACSSLDNYFVSEETSRSEAYHARDHGTDEPCDGQGDEGWDHSSFLVDEVMHFPLPLAFDSDSNSTLSEDAVILPESPVRQPVDVYSHSDDTQINGGQRPRAASELTVKPDRPHLLLPVSESPKLTAQAGDPAEFDVEKLAPTARKESPMSSETTFDQDSSQSDSVQSLYEQYLDYSIPEGDSLPLDEGLHSPRQGPVASPDSSQSSHCSSSHSPCHSPFSPSAAVPSNIPPSEIVFRPLLTGRRSLLETSLLGRQHSPKIPTEARLDSSQASSSLQTIEVGRTVVPLGFRRRHRVDMGFASGPRIPEDDCTSPLRCSSADLITHKEPPIMPSSYSAPPSSRLKPLRLSRRFSILAPSSSSIVTDTVSQNILSTSTVLSQSVSSSSRLARNSLLSSPCHSPIPEHICNTTTCSDAGLPTSSTFGHIRSPCFPPSPRTSRSFSAPVQPSAWRLSNYRAGSRNFTSIDRQSFRRNSILSCSYSVHEEEDVDGGHLSGSDPAQSHHDCAAIPASTFDTSIHAIATPKPTLLFAIASDDVEKVQRVLDSGEAGPNDPVGPQSALAFTLTNDKLSHKGEIVKALLAYGADPSVLRNPALNPPASVDEDQVDIPMETTPEGMDPATRYFVARADARHTRQTSRLIYRSFFRPLTRIRYDVIGQDWALEQLFRVLSMHSQRLAMAPIVVLLCGPSGHGKSLLARKFGSLLEIPTHTVNMTTLRSSHDIWQCYSMSPYEEPSWSTLAEFLTRNEGERCVVVLDEIEKTENHKALWSLLMPWELGRCSLEAGKPHVDVRNVIWLGTSNIGHELVFEHQKNRSEPENQMSQEEYLQLTEVLRPRVSDCLGPSLMSRVSAILPFVPFTVEEKKAIAAEAVYSSGGEAIRASSPQEVETLALRALENYIPGEGARSLHRAISNQLMDAL